MLAFNLLANTFTKVLMNKLKKKKKKSTKKNIGVEN